MKSLWVVKAFLLVCACIGLIGFIPLSQSHFFSLPTLMLIGIIMISLDLAFNIKPSPLNHDSFKPHYLKLNNQIAASHHEANMVEHKPYHFLIAKIGGLMVVLSFLIQCLLQ